jgi:hypothetical protein
MPTRARSATCSRLPITLFPTGCELGGSREHGTRVLDSTRILGHPPGLVLHSKKIQEFRSPIARRFPSFYGADVVSAQNSGLARKSGGIS